MSEPEYEWVVLFTHGPVSCDDEDHAIEVSQRGLWPIQRRAWQDGAIIEVWDWEPSEAQQGLIPIPREYAEP